MTRPIILTEARALADHLAGLYGAQVLTHDDPGAIAAAAVLDLMAPLIPGGADVVDAIHTRGMSVSVTVPTPIGTMELLSYAATSTALGLAETGTHEATHARWIHTTSGIQTIKDYLGSRELRAMREAHAYASGMTVRYLLTGVLPDGESELASLGASLYLLSSDDRALGREIVLGAIDALRESALPPLAVAHAALDWLREHAPDAIAAEAFRVTL